MGRISKIFANEFTNSTAQNRASQKGSKSRLHLVYASQNSNERKKYKQKRFFDKKLLLEESCCYADARPLPQTLLKYTYAWRIPLVNNMVFEES